MNISEQRILTSTCRFSRLTEIHHHEITYIQWHIGTRTKENSRSIYYLQDLISILLLLHQIKHWGHQIQAEIVAIWMIQIVINKIKMVRIYIEIELIYNILNMQITNRFVLALYYIYNTSSQRSCQQIYFKQKCEKGKSEREEKQLDINHSDVAVYVATVFCLCVQ